MLPLFVEIKLKKSKIKTITVSDEVMDNLENAFKKLRKEGIENEKKMQNETWYIDYFGEMLTLHEALDRFYKNGIPKKK